MKMKRVSVLIILLGSLSGHVLANYRLQAKITWLENYTKIYLKHNLAGKPVIVDSTTSVNGQFIFKGFLKESPEYYFVFIDKRDKYLPILLDHSKIYLVGEIASWPNVKITGSKIIDESISFKLKYDKLEPRDRLDFLKKFVFDNRESFYSPVALYQANLSGKEEEEGYRQLSAKVKESYYAKKLKESYTQKEAIANIVVGKTAPDFISNDPNGIPKPLSKFVKKSKLTLVDFWGSWCVPCREELPGIKKVYDAFHENGFNVLSVGLETNEKSWKEAINTLGMSWDHVSQLKGRNEDAHQIYAVNGVPAYLLIDQSGKILAVDLPGSVIPSAGGKLRGDDLYKKVEKLLGK